MLGGGVGFSLGQNLFQGIEHLLENRNGSAVHGEGHEESLMGWRLRRLGRGVTTLDDSACVSAALTLNRLTAPISACFSPG
jgi:hypothetical protein